MALQIDTVKLNMSQISTMHADLKYIWIGKKNKKINQQLCSSMGWGNQQTLPSQNSCQMPCLSGLQRQMWVMPTFACLSSINSLEHLVLVSWQDAETNSWQKLNWTLQQHLMATVIPYRHADRYNANNSSAVDFTWHFTDRAEIVVHLEPPLFYSHLTNYNYLAED